MKFNNHMAALMSFFLILGVSQATYGQDLKTAKDSISYANGILFAKSLKMSKIDNVNTEVIKDGLKDYLHGKELKMSEKEAEAYYSKYLNKIKEKEKAMAKEAGEKFLAENAKKEGVVVTESGLQYEVLKSGSGATPGPTDKVLAHYHGMLTDGRVFDSSVDRGEPITLPVNGVIMGWQEALQMMKEGDKWRLYIPYNLAYGARGAGPLIAPYSALIFDVELLEVQ